MLADNDLVIFWFGIIKPGNEIKEKCYDLLGEQCDALLPIKFISVLVMANGARLIEQIEGFMWMELSDDSIVTESRTVTNSH